MEQSPSWDDDSHSSGHYVCPYDFLCPLLSMTFLCICQPVLSVGISAKNIYVNLITTCIFVTKYVAVSGLIK